MPLRGYGLRARLGTALGPPAEPFRLMPAGGGVGGEKVCYFLNKFY